jgi:hypothetical protein
MCIYPNCKTTPSYNVEGETNALYCVSHKLEGMIDVIHKTCIYFNCKVRPSYNVEGETKALYCASHKLEEMIDIKHKTCIYPNCKSRPCYNVEGEKNALYCATHKLEGMIDVKHKTCIYPNCKSRPNYNVKGEKNALYCATHKLEGMIDVNHKTCIYPNCISRPNYNVKGEKNALYCATHKLERMIDVIHKTCKNGWCYTRVQEKYDGYCLFCYINMFPDKPVSRNYKTKEYAVIEYVKNKFFNLNWKTDKKINGGCSKRRPDLLLDLGYQIVIIEIDENQHINYDCSCENKRIMEISKDLAHRPIVFIRFNPDEYETNGETISSCWGINKKGICVIKKRKTEEWNQRLKILEEHINYWINPENKTNKIVEIIQLFYDI